jgi:hypothetical protein
MAIARLQRNGQYRHLIELNGVKIPYIPMSLIRGYTLFTVDLQNCSLAEVRLLVFAEVALPHASWPP